MIFHTQKNNQQALYSLIINWLSTLYTLLSPHSKLYTLFVFVNVNVFTSPSHGGGLGVSLLFALYQMS